MIEIRRWSLNEFEQAQPQWDALVAKLGFPGLFLCWHWQQQWWRCWSWGQELCLFAAYRGGELVGILPLYLTTVRYKSVIPSRRLQFIGNCWRGMTTVRSEFLDVIVADDDPQADQICAELAARVMEEVSFDEWVVQDCLDSSRLGRWLAARANGYLRCEAKEQASYVDLQQEFDGYLNQLSRNTRRQAFNKRRILDELGRVEFVSGQTANYFTALAQLHHMRWHAPLFHNGAEHFHQAVNQALLSPLSSLICLDGVPISAIYCLDWQQRCYFIQAGFNVTLDKRLSLGLMHLLYSIEDGLGHYQSLELLVGRGMQSDYKLKLASDARQLSSWRWLKSPMMAGLFERYDQIKGESQPSLERQP